MTWWAIDVRAAPEERERLGAWLVARTGQAVEERDDGTLVTFAPDDATADRLIAELGRETKAPAETSRRRIEPVDWSTRWRDGLGARRFGRLTVTPSWVPPAARGRSGGHARTRDGLRQRRARLDSGGAHAAGAVGPRRRLRPGPRQRQRHPRHRRGKAWRLAGGRYRAGCRGEPGRREERRAERRSGGGRVSPRATPPISRPCSVPPTSSSPTSSAS